MYKIAKIILIATLVLLAIVLIFGLVLILGWPWWVGFFVLLGVFGLWLGLMFFRKLWLRRREQNFVEQIIEQDDLTLNAMGNKEKEASKGLQNSWKEAIEALKTSHLKKHGNPLYVLPWYLVIGESGSGKTTAIKSARLSSTFTDVKRTSGISGTRNCDWWFFEQAIILDTAGRYAVPIDEGRDRDEWRKFLSLLVKFRKKEPVNGLVVTVGADKLLEAAPDVLEEDGRNIRRRIDELMRVLGAKSPVYVLITKCDLIQGMTQFCDYLPDNVYGQAMGVTNNDLSSGAASINNRAVKTIGERLRDIRLLLFHKVKLRIDDKRIDPGLLLFPEEFERIETGLSIFIKGAFYENPYQETPILRGMFFSSGRQEGRPYSHFLKALGLIDERDILPGTNKGLFLHDLFSRILPEDRKLFTPTQTSLNWNRLTRNLGLTSWVAIIIGICGLLSFSFVKNLKTLRVISDEFSTPPVLQGEVVMDAAIMDRFRQAIITIEDQNSSWWIPRFGLNESIDVEKSLKDRYRGQFADRFLTKFTSQMGSRIAGFDSFTPDQDLGAHIVHLVRRINLLNACLKGEDIEILQSRPQPAYDPITFVTAQRLLPEVRELFEDLYLYHMIWARKSSELNQEMNTLHTYLKHILREKGISLDWLIDWANRTNSISGLTLEDFWGEGDSEFKEVNVPGAFTTSGKEKIDSLLLEIDSALFDPLIIATKKMEFQERYRNLYIRAWYDFGAVFPRGKDRLKGRDEWQKVISKMGTEQGPFFALLARMTEELKPVAKNKDIPNWVNLVYKFEETKVNSANFSIFDKKDAVTKNTRWHNKLLSTFERNADILQAERLFEANKIAAKAFLDYQNAMPEVSPVFSSRKAAYQMAVQTCGADSGTGGSPFAKAQNAIVRLKPAIASPGSSEEMFWDLVNGPLDCLWIFVLRETACHLQGMWDDVTVELQDVSDPKSATQLLFGKDGYALKFIKGPAGPFISRDLIKGYSSEVIMGHSIPFEKDFLDYLMKGSKIGKLTVKDFYGISITGMPTDTYFRSSFDGDKVGADTTRLELQCADESRILLNRNYRVKKKFIWSPRECGDVILSISVGNRVLNKKYAGNYAFPMFLAEFSKGKRRFYPSEFPDEEAALKRMGIRYIKVQYRLFGHWDVIKLLGQDLGKVPTKIIECWAH